MMKLDNLVEEMTLPPEISPPEKNMYLDFLMYQEYFEKYPICFDLFVGSQIHTCQHDRKTD